MISKTIYHNLYHDLLSLIVLFHYSKNLSIDFVTGLLLFVNKKDNDYDIFLIIAYYLIKMVPYKPIKNSINVAGLAKVIIYVVFKYFGLLESIISNRAFFFILKFFFLLYYFLNIKQKFSITFYLYINSQTKRQNFSIKINL